MLFRSGDDVWTIALHEAGHAVVADALGQIVRRISCRPGPGSDGNTSIADLPAHPTADDVDRALTIAMGGRAADEILGSGANAGAAGDLDIATGLAIAARRSLGLRGSLSHLEPKAGRRTLVSDPELMREVEGDLRRALDRARGIVEERREAVDAVARQLVERQVLSGEALQQVLAGVRPAGEARDTRSRLRSSKRHERSAGAAVVPGSGSGLAVRR